MAHKEFLRRTLKTMNRKFIGFDIRILPLLGIFALIISAIFWWENRWADVLLFGALVILCIFFSLSAYEVWKEDTDKMSPYYKVYLSQKATPYKFISLEPYMLGIDKETNEIKGIGIRLRSWLLYDISIDNVIVELQFPMDGSSYKTVQFSMKKLTSIQLHSIVNHELKHCYCETQLLCSDKVNDIHHITQQRLGGQAKLFTDFSSTPMIIDIWGDVTLDKGSDLEIEKL